MTKHKAAWWAKRVEELERNGDEEAVARDHGVRAKTLQWWRSELKRRARGGSHGRARLLPVVVESEARGVAMGSSGKLEVRITVGDSRITMRGEVTAEHLVSIVKGLRVRC